MDKINELYLEGCNCFNCSQSHIFGEDNHLECRFKKVTINEYDVCEDWKE